MNPINESPLHSLWSKAVGTPGYDKEEWKALQDRLLSLTSACREALSALGTEGCVWDCKPGEPCRLCVVRRGLREVLGRGG